MADFNDFDDFGDYQGTTVGAAVVEQWNYPAFGYNATKGVFMIGQQEVVKELFFIPFALRQRKSIIDPKTENDEKPVTLGYYHYKTPGREMVPGKLRQHMQVVGLLNGQLYIFGAKSWTGRAAWTNPAGSHRDDQFQTGLWPRLETYIANVKAKKNIDTTPLCYELHLGVGESMEVKQKNTNKSTMTHPIVCHSVRFVGKEQADANSELYQREKLDEWVALWHNMKGKNSGPNNDDDDFMGYDDPGFNDHSYLTEDWGDR